MMPQDSRKDEQMWPLASTSSGSRHRKITAFAAGSALLLVAGGALAGQIAIDFGVSPGTLDVRGNNFGNSFEVDRTGNAAGAGIDLGFAARIGSDTYTRIFIHENGFVSFGSALSPGVYSPVASLAALGGPVIAPFYADLASAAPDGSVFSALDGEVFYQTGVADAEADAGGNYSPAEAGAALRATWYGPSWSGTENAYTQLLLYSRGGGDFDIRFNYGISGASATPAVGALAGFALGADSLAFVPSYFDAADRYYQFRDGRLVGGPPTPVSEPSSLALLGICGLLLAMTRLRPPTLLKPTYPT
jgi:hypothetical protein